MTATNKLKAKLIECGFTQTAIARMLKISYQTFNNKLNNKVELKASEIDALCEILGIEDKDAYFFCDANSQNG